MVLGLGFWDLFGPWGWSSHERKSALMKGTWVGCLVLLPCEDSRRRSSVKQEASPRQTPSPPCLDLGLCGLQNWKKDISTFDKPPRLLLCSGSLNRLRQLTQLDRSPASHGTSWEYSLSEAPLNWHMWNGSVNMAGGRWTFSQGRR